jgi:hypothetical protein
MYKALFSLVFILGAYLIWFSGKKITLCKKYEFENRTDGGVVKFSSYEEAEKFRRRKKGAEGQQSSGYVLCIVSGFLLVFAFQLHS